MSEMSDNYATYNLWRNAALSEYGEYSLLWVIIIILAILLNEVR
jgi:hypothetical protein